MQTNSFGWIVLAVGALCFAVVLAKSVLNYVSKQRLTGGDYEFDESFASSESGDEPLNTKKSLVATFRAQRLRTRQEKDDREGAKEVVPLDVRITRAILARHARMTARRSFAADKRLAERGGLTRKEVIAASVQKAKLSLKMSVAELKVARAKRKALAKKKSAVKADSKKRLQVKKEAEAARVRESKRVAAEEKREVEALRAAEQREKSKKSKALKAKKKRVKREMATRRRNARRDTYRLLWAAVSDRPGSALPSEHLADQTAIGSTSTESPAANQDLFRSIDEA